MIFIITYGSEQLFRGGWSVVHANSREEAIETLLYWHPVVRGMLYSKIFSNVYTVEQFGATSMPNTGNLGKFMQEELWAPVR